MSFISTDGCYVCGTKITYNALLVPSFVDHGVKRPLCQECVEYANRKRMARGLSEIKIWPNTYEPFNEFKFEFIGTVEAPPPKLIKGWREKPDLYRFVVGVYWSVTMSAQEPHDVVSFSGKVE
jgi:hypothetical protein